MVQTASSAGKSYFVTHFFTARLLKYCPITKYKTSQAKFVTSLEPESVPDLENYLRMDQEKGVLQVMRDDIPKEQLVINIEAYSSDEFKVEIKEKVYF